MQGHVPSFVFKCSQKGFLLIVKTSAGFTVMDQNVTHELHLPLLRIITEKSGCCRLVQCVLIPAVGHA